MRRILLICLALAALATPAHAAVRHAAGTRDTKPADAAAAAAPAAVFDCAGRDTLDLVPGFAATLADTTAGASLLDAYACRAWPETGPEHIYRLEVAADVEFAATILPAHPWLDLDLYLLDGCDTEACVIGENISLAASLGPGTYWLVVDGYGASTAPDSTKAGPYTLELAARAPGLPDEACTGAATGDLRCDIGTTFTESGSLFGATDLVRSYDCNPFLARAGEAWFAVRLLPGQALTATTTSVADSLDAVLWLFAGCGPDAQCLASADQRTAGQPETLSWQSAVAETLTVYLAVDGARAPATPTAGSWELGVTCGTEVPTGRTTFGGIRALFR
ncbi:MAG TPA: hypothetical protein PLQ13_13150 [Candidatus Krumholzibacteria bacterium]|nr:hypothetical protein [Candidatus Krumholzibacteria bacterium]